MAKEAQEIIERQVTHMTRLVDDLLDVTRIAHGRIHLQREIVELGAVVTKTIDDHRTGFQASGLRLENCVAGGPFWVNGDPARLTQVMSNLLGNARKFTPPGGAVAVFAGASDEHLTLRVRDTGQGISPTYQDHIFEPFVQAPQSLDRRGGGLGLGLAMVKGLIELHGGTVAIHSDGEGQGTEVTISLPLHAAPAESTHVAERQRTTRRRILIIEDNTDAANTLQTALSLWDHDVRVAYNGPEGLEVARSFRPEIVICDIGLPGMDGYEVARSFRSDEELRGVYLVALSGYAQLEDRRRAATAGFNQHVAKPPSLEVIDRVLADAPTPVEAQGLH